MMVHVLIRQTARDMAAAQYEELAKDNAFFKQWPKAHQFVNAAWRNYIEIARAALTEMLSGDHPQSMKDEIYDALLKDNALPGRGTRHQALN